MRNVLASALVLGVIGLVVGYFLFAHVGDGYLPLDRLLGISNSFGDRVANALTKMVVDIGVVRRNILISGLVGVVLGFVVSLSGRRRRRR